MARNQSIISSNKTVVRYNSFFSVIDDVLKESKENFLIPYRKGKLWGFANRKKEIVIDVNMIRQNHLKMDLRV